MASFHLSVKTVQRSAGRSATAAAAYRHAERIECQREGRVHDYTRKQGVVDSFIVAPDEAPAWAQDRAALWNAAEARDTRVNSVTAREWELALPAELDAPERRAIVHDFARALVARYGVAADVAIHAPHREGDGRNWHAHVMTTTRVLTREGLTDKTRVLDVPRTGGPEIVHMRERWAEMQNHALERHGLEARVDHRSLEAQREAALAQGHKRQAEELDRAAEVKLGPVVSAIERRERRAAEREARVYEPQTERGALVHEARAARALLHELVHARDRLRERVREELRERAEAARETYSHAREVGATPVRAGLAALRAAVERHGLGEQGHGLAHGQGLEHGRDEEQERQPRHGAEPQSIKERLGRLLGREAARDEETARTVARPPERTPAPKHGAGSVREELERLRAQEASRTPRTREAIREELERRREQESRRAHEVTRERLNEALGRIRSTEREVDREEAPTHKHRERGHEDDGHGWGL